MAIVASSSDSRWKYDVFLNFRGEDTRRIFVGHLYKALDQKTIHTFYDSEEVGKGNDLSVLLRAIQESRLSIVVFSPNYASSTWCLNELVQIMDCMDKENQIVVPIFYQVDPSDIRKQKGNFAEAFAKHECDNLAEVEIWRSALMRASNLSGWDSKNYKDDVRLIEDIVRGTLNKLTGRWSSNSSGLVGMDFHMQQMRQLLIPKEDEAVRTVGIWGMGGLGKTTIARAVYDDIAQQFDHSCFLENVKESFLEKNGAIRVQKELLSRILKEKNEIPGALDRGSKMIMERLGKKKVLLVLDDVDSLGQIESLIGKDPSWGFGSKIIITTRDRHLLGWDNGHYTYSPKCLSDATALVLFRQYAFRTNKPSGGGYDHLSRRAIRYAHGLPLALKVLGAFLHNKSVPEWEDELEKIRVIPDKGIHAVLRTSFDGLDDVQKSIFLDIACFYRGQNKVYVTKFLDSCGFFPHTGLRVLVDKALLTISYQNTIEMHDLIQEMGWEIGRSSRLWRHKDVDRMLTPNAVTEAVEGISLDLKESKELYLDIEAFVMMKKLRLLQIVDHNSAVYDGQEWKNFSTGHNDCKQQVSSHDLKFLSQELRYLIWDGCPLESLPSNFHPKNLVCLHMPYSHIEKLWEGRKPLQSLEYIDLSHSQYLERIPDLTYAVNLEKLNLEGCKSLSKIHPSILALKNLVYLSLKGCSELRILPTSIFMESLQRLDLSGCSNLEKFPEISEIMNELSELHLDGTAIKKLPSSINKLNGIVILSVNGCTELTSLPISFYMEKLSQLYLDGTAIKELPSSIYHLTRLVTLSLNGCSEFNSLPGSIYMKSLKFLHLSGCSNLKKFPEISGVMPNLSELLLDQTAIEKLPYSIHNLTGLVTLSLKDCRHLKSLPRSVHMKSLKFLHLSGCSNLDKLPEMSDVMAGLSELYLDGTAIACLPSSIDQLQGLHLLCLRNCKNLMSLPDSICNLEYLKDLFLDGCSLLHKLPKELEKLRSLRTLKLEGSGIKQLTFTILRLSMLKTLSCKGCKEMTAPLSSWPSSNWSFSDLLHLDLSDCNMLILSAGVAHLFSLESLKLCRNNFESLPTTMNLLTRLKYLLLEGCKRLRSIPDLSETIEFIDAHDCKALGRVSTPKPPYKEKFCFQFSNCFQLMLTTPFHDIVEAHSVYQDKQLRPLFSRGDFRTRHIKMVFNYQCRGFSVTLPGSQIPHWFNHQCMGSSISVQLPPHQFFSKFVGIAICVVSNFQNAPNNVSLRSASFVCTLKGNHGEKSFSFPLLRRRSKTCALLESDHLYLSYKTCLIGKKDDDGYYTQATFRVVVAENGASTDDSMTKEDCSCITSCGVRLFHVNHEEFQTVDPIQPINHVDNLAHRFNMSKTKRTKRKRENP